MARKAKLDWEVYREQLCQLKYSEGKSLTAICKILHEKLGVSITAARLSQKFTEWRIEQANREISTEELERKLEAAVAN